MKNMIKFSFFSLLIILFIGCTALHKGIIKAENSMAMGSYYFIATDSREDMITITSASQTDLVENIQPPIASFKNKKQSIKYKLVFYNKTTDKFQNIIEIGYPPFAWVISKDHKQLFITYCSDIEQSKQELIHCNFLKGIAERLALPCKSINNISLSTDESTVFVLGDDKSREPLKLSKAFTDFFKKDKMSKNYNGIVLTLGHSSLRVKSSHTIDNPAIKVFSITPSKVAVICQDWTDYSTGIYSLHEGNILLLDTYNNRILQKSELPQGHIYTQFIPEKKILIVTVNSYLLIGVNSSVLIGPNQETYDRYGRPIKKNNDDFSDRTFNISGDSFFYKITDSSIKTVKALPWLNFEYIPELSTLYSLNQRNLELINFQFSKPNESVEIRSLIITDEKPLFENFFYRIPGTNRAIIYGLHDNYIQVYDVSLNKLLSKEKCGRQLVNIIEKKEDPNLSVAANSKYIFVLSHRSKDITVFDYIQNNNSVIVPPETPLKMYQIKSMSEVLVVTTEQVYKMSKDGTNLLPIYRLKQKAKKVEVFETEAILVITTDKEKVQLTLPDLEIR